MAASLKHGQSRRRRGVGNGTKAYEAWHSMHQRCRAKNTRSKAHMNYVGRGITVCERWAKFENFFEDMGHCPAGLSLDRIDNDKGYEPGNCRWASRQEQARNTRANVFLEFNGEVLCLRAWAEKLGINKATVYWRTRMGWPITQILSTKKYKNKWGRE